MPFPPDVAERALLDSGRYCCLCHIFCGTKIELHHIVAEADGGPDTYDNCIPLCFNCHAEVRAYDPRHPKGRRFTPSELRGHRDKWYEKVRNSQGVTANPDYIELDRKLFTQIRELLPSVGIMTFLRDHVYMGAFPFDVHLDLYRFLENCRAPEFEFLDADLESLRNQLRCDIEEFLATIGQKTFPIKPGVNRVFAPDEVEMRATSHDQVEQAYARARRTGDTLNELAQKICETYDELIRLGRRKLAI